jgi:BirA family biotin operon repressor/biotin-[acetyl-CoA-carboxylase] ligase
MNVPSSSSMAIRSRAVFLPLACCFSTARRRPGVGHFGDAARSSASLPAVTGDIVVGTGLNVHHTTAELPVPTATSLALALGGEPPSREELIGRYLANLAARHTQLCAGGAAAAVLRADYRAACTTIGRDIRIHQGGSARLAHADGVDDAGRLLVSGPAGRATVAAGDVEHIRPLT